MMEKKRDADRQRLILYLCQYSPSKILPMMPGPSSTDNGFPVLNTGSPTVTPAFSELRSKHFIINVNLTKKIVITEWGVGGGGGVCYKYFIIKTNLNNCY